MEVALRGRESRRSAEGGYRPAEKSLTDSSLGQFAGAVPELSKINTGSATVDAGTQLFGSALALQALGQAGRDAAADIAARIPDKSKYLLVTTEADLASTDAIYAQVEDGLQQLLQAAQALKATAVKEFVPQTADADTAAHRESVIAAGVGIAASALPAVVSLFSANRKISGGSVSADDMQAVIGVASADGGAAASAQGAHG